MGDSAKSPCIQELRRFLYLGDDSKIYPHSIRFPFCTEKTKCIDDMKSSGMGLEAVKEILLVYKNGHYLESETLVFALALLANSKNNLVKSSALKAATEVCSSAGILLSFTHFYKELAKPSKGWGNASRKFLIRWYNGRDAKALAIDVTKCKSRLKWTHKDVLCMAHVKAENKGNAAVLKYLMRGIEAAEKEFESEPEAEPVVKYLKGAHELSHTTDSQAAARLIEIHDLCLEHIPSKMLLSREVALTAIKRIPLKELLKQLPRFNRVGLIRVNNPHYKALLERLSSAESLSDGSVGPLETFLALRKWQISNKIQPGKPNPRQSMPALDEALQNLHGASFKSLKSTEKRYLIAMDTNPTMNHSHCSGCLSLTPSHVSDISLMALVKAEASTVVVFSTGDEDVVPVDILPSMSLGDVVENLKVVPPGPAVLSSPINWALTKKMPFDVFVLFTDLLSSTKGDDLSTVFNEYKSTMHLPDTRFVVCSLCDQTSTFTERDPSYLNIIGFNPKLMNILQDFACCTF